LVDQIPDIVPVFRGRAGPAAMGKAVGVAGLAAAAAGLAALAGYSNLIFVEGGPSPLLPARALRQTDGALLCPAARGLLDDAAVRPDVPDDQALMRAALQTSKGIDQLGRRTGKPQGESDLGLEIRDGLVGG
jgi:hypothetical protein